MYCDDYYLPPRVVHVPIRAPREGTPGEVIYSRRWKEWAEANPREWVGIFRDCLERPRQRAASVAASFMVFMGCNAGRGFTHLAERLAKGSAFSNRGEAFRAAWSLENARHAGVNHGLRSAEYMLAAQHPVVDAVFGRRPARSLMPTITAEDNDYLEAMAIWWSGLEASAMRAAAVPEIAAATDRILQRLHHHPTHTRATA